MELMEFLKSAAELGLTVPMAIGLSIIWQINKKFNRYDVRISVLESKHRRHDDN